MKVKEVFQLNGRARERTQYLHNVKRRYMLLSCFVWSEKAAKFIKMLQQYFSTVVQKNDVCLSFSFRVVVRCSLVYTHRMTDAVNFTAACWLLPSWKEEGEEKKSRGSNEKFYGRFRVYFIAADVALLNYKLREPDASSETRQKRQYFRSLLTQTKRKKLIIASCELWAARDRRPGSGN